MPKLKISDNHSHAEEFSANTQSEFVRELNRAVTRYQAYMRGQPVYRCLGDAFIKRPRLHIYDRCKKHWVAVGFNTVRAECPIDMTQVFRDRGNSLWCLVLKAQMGLKKYEEFFRGLDKFLRDDPEALRKNFRVVK